MPEAISIDKSLAEAVAKFVNALHHIYSEIEISPVPKYEDEDFTFEITIPKDYSLDEVLETCHKECIKVEDEYDLFILPNVAYA